MLRTFLGLITVQTITYDDKHSKDIRRNSHQLGMSTLETQRSNDSRREVSKGVERVGHEEIRDGEEPEEVIGDGFFGDFAVPVFVVHGGRVGAETFDGKGSFFGGEPGDGLGVCDV